MLSATIVMEIQFWEARVSYFWVVRQDEMMAVAEVVVLVEDGTQAEREARFAESAA